MTGGRELYIYYRAPVDRASALQTAVSAFQADWRAQVVGLQARLLRRPSPKDGWHTWMEIYALPDNPLGISDELQENIEAAAQHLPIHASCTTRHVEIFRACA